VPTVAGTCKLRFAHKRGNIDLWQEQYYKIGELATGTISWEAAEPLNEPYETDIDPEHDALFKTVPPELTDAKQFAALAKSFKDHLYRQVRLKLWECADLKEVSSPDESEGDFRVRMREKIRELRDEMKEKLRAKYAPKLAALEERLRKAEQQLEKQKSMSQQGYFSAALSIFSAVVSAVFGRKLRSTANVTRATSGARAANRAMSKRGDVQHAEETVEAIQAQVEALDAELQAEIAKIAAFEPPITPLEIAPKKTEIQIDRVVLAWEPWIFKDGESLRSAT
jgi:hypothetical protein